MCDLAGIPPSWVLVTRSQVRACYYFCVAELLFVLTYTVGECKPLIIIHVNMRGIHHDTLLPAPHPALPACYCLHLIPHFLPP